MQLDNVVRIGLALLLIVVGILFQLLLDGQVFTHSLLGIACLCGAAALCLASERGKDERIHPSLVKRLVACLCLTVIVLLAFELPSAYQFQNKFNQRAKENREKRERGKAAQASRQLRPPELSAHSNLLIKPHHPPTV